MRRTGVHGRAADQKSQGLAIPPHGPWLAARRRNTGQRGREGGGHAVARDGPPPAHSPPLQYARPMQCYKP